MPHAVLQADPRPACMVQGGLPCNSLMPRWQSQVDDKSNLEYQAGQPDEDDGNQQEPDEKQEQDRQKQAQEDKQVGQEAGPEEDGGDEQGDDEEGGVYEDADDQYEDRQFAQPQVGCRSGATCMERCMPGPFRDFRALHRLQAHPKLLPPQPIWLKSRPSSVLTSHRIHAFEPGRMLDKHSQYVQAPEEDFELPEDMELGDEEGGGSDDDGQPDELPGAADEGGDLKDADAGDADKEAAPAEGQAEEPSAQRAHGKIYKALRFSTHLGTQQACCLEVCWGKGRGREDLTSCQCPAQRTRLIRKATSAERTAKPAERTPRRTRRRTRRPQGTASLRSRCRTQFSRRRLQSLQVRAFPCLGRLRSDVGPGFAAYFAFVGARTML